MKKLLFIVVVCVIIKACFSVAGKWTDNMSTHTSPLDKAMEPAVQDLKVNSPPPVAVAPLPPRETQDTYPPQDNQPTREEEERARQEQERLAEEAANPPAPMNPLLEQVTPNSLVSCQTKTRFCEPQAQMNFPDGDVTTFCTTYAGNCMSQDSIRKIWRYEEVFRAQVIDPRNDPNQDNYPNYPPPVEPNYDPNNYNDVPQEDNRY